MGWPVENGRTRLELAATVWQKPLILRFLTLQLALRGYLVGCDQAEKKAEVAFGDLATSPSGSHNFNKKGCSSNTSERKQL